MLDAFKARYNIEARFGKIQPRHIATSKSCKCAITTVSLLYCAFA